MHLTLLSLTSIVAENRFGASREKLSILCAELHYLKSPAMQEVRMLLADGESSRAADGTLADACLDAHDNTRVHSLEHDSDVKGASMMQEIPLQRTIRSWQDFSGACSEWGDEDTVVCGNGSESVSGDDGRGEICMVIAELASVERQQQLLEKNVWGAMSVMRDQQTEATRLRVELEAMRGLHEQQLMTCRETLEGRHQCDLQEVQGE